MKQRAILLINPRARQGKKALAKAKEYLHDLGIVAKEEIILNPQELSSIIERYHQQCDLVIIGGGDGTLNSAVPGLLSTGLPLGILPLGTANNLARTLAIPQSLFAACKVIADGTTRKIDLGLVNGHYFLNVAGIGLSAQINHRVTSAAKRRWGLIAYAATALEVVRQAPVFSAEITQSQTETIQVQAAQLTVCNGRYYGSGLIIADDAAIDDARLDLYGFSFRHWWEIIPQLPSMMRGKHKIMPNVFWLQGREITIKTSIPYPLDADGEIVTSTPAKFQVVPKALCVFVPTNK